MHFRCLLPIFPALLPWAMTPPNIILKLHEVPKKATPATIYHAHFLEIIDSLPDAILCFTHGPKIGNRTSFAFSIGNDIFSYRHLNFVSVLTVHFPMLGIYPVPPFSPNTFLVGISSNSHFRRPLHSPSGLANPHPSLHLPPTP